jgi:hypothetical protein
LYHSITFGDKNTWDDWHIVPSSRPVFNPPSLKRKILDIPGADGSIDLSESLTGYPVYTNREGSLEFIVMNGYKQWYQAYSDIMDYLHGKTMRAILEDDQEYFYEGRFTINEWKSSKDWSRIVIDYDLGPYKWLLRASLDDWEWDIFNFYTGIIPANVFKNIPVTESYEAHTFEKGLFGRAPVCPSFIVSTVSGNGMYIRFINNELGIDITKLVQNGTTQIPEFLFLGDTVTVYFKCVSGTGTVSINFRQGRL